MLRPPHILIVDDDAGFRDVTAAALQRQGWPCRCAETPAAASAALQAQSYDLIIVGINMPDIWELAFLQTLHTRRSPIPVLVANAHPSTYSAVVAFYPTVVDICPKPLDLDALPQRLRQAIQQGRRFSAATPTSIQDAPPDLEAQQVATRAWREAEEKLQIFFHACLDAVFIIDSDSGQIQHVNRSAGLLLGYTEAQLIGQPFDQLLVSSLTPEMTVESFPLHVYGPVFASQTVRRIDGSLCPVDLTATVMPWEQREAILITLRDVTERQRIEDTLRDSEERFRHLIEGSIQGVSIFHDTRPLFVNQAYATIFGYETPDDILRMGTLLPLIAPHERERLQGNYAAHLRGEESSVHDEYQGLRQDGSLIWLESVVRLIHWRGAPALQATTVDITERKQVEAELYKAKAQLENRVAERTADLRRSNDQLRQEIAERTQAEQEIKARARQQAAVAALSQSALAYGDPARLIADAVALIAQTLQMEYCLLLEHHPYNQTLFLQAGVGWQEGLVGQAALKNDSASLAAYLWQANAAVIIEDLHTDTRFTSPSLLHDHGVRSGMSILINSRIDHQPFGILGVYTTDVRSYAQHDLYFLQAIANVLAQAIERKRTEEALHQSTEQQRQLQKMEALGRLAGGVAHDFNNLLTIILGYSDLVLQDLRADEFAYNSVVQIKKAAERGSGLTRHLLAFSRKQYLELAVLDLNTVITEVEKMLQRLLGEDITIKIIKETPLGRVQADLGQIEQVMLNLAVNARDAMPHGGILTLETANVVLPTRTTSPQESVTTRPYVMLTIRDTGCGMDAATQAQMFEPFFTTKEQGKGTGLGLSTVYGIIEQSGGHIQVSSTPGAGARFDIYLPQVDGAQQATPLVADSGRARLLQGSETILLVEDEDSVRVLLRTNLQKCGYTVLAARHGAEALQISAQHDGPIHLLITDVVMPQMGGYELATRLTTQRPEMRMLFISGYLDDLLESYNREDSKIPLLQKPIIPSIFEHKVREILETPVRRHESVFC